jgi:hypothetical protein
MINGSIKPNFDKVFSENYKKRQKKLKTLFQYFLNTAHTNSLTRYDPSGISPQNQGSNYQLFNLSSDQIHNVLQVISTILDYQQQINYRYFVRNYGNFPAEIQDVFGYKGSPVLSALGFTNGHLFKTDAEISEIIALRLKSFVGEILNIETNLAEHINFRAAFALLIAKLVEKGHTDFSFLSFNGLELEQLCFKNCNLRGADFTDAFLSKVEFTKCDLESSIFKGTEFENCKINNCSYRLSEFDSIPLDSQLSISPPNEELKGCVVKVRQRLLAGIKFTKGKMGLLRRQVFRCSPLEREIIEKAISVSKKRNVDIEWPCFITGNEPNLERMCILREKISSKIFIYDVEAIGDWFRKNPTQCPFRIPVTNLEILNLAELIKLIKFD